MPVRLLFFCIAISACDCGRLRRLIPTEPLIVPARIEVPRTWVGFPRAVTFELTNPDRVVRGVTLSVEAPFTVQPADVTLPAAETATLTLTFAPSDAGQFEQTLTVVDVSTDPNTTHEVQVSAVAELPPPCPATEACRTFRFDPELGSCTSTNRTNGSMCTGLLACFATAECRDGQCAGTAVTCDDRDVCTVDTCSEAGCGHVDGTPYCPASTNPCLVQSCSRDGGCGFSEMPDGTACGERTCTTARVCIAGTCVNRTPPKSQACAEVIIGVPAGNASIDARGADARFEHISSLATNGIDTVFSQGTLLRLIRGSSVTTIAGQRGTPGLVDGVGSAARLQSPTVAVSPRPGTFFVGDGSAIRLASAQGLVVTIAGGPDAGVRDGVGAAALLEVSSPIRSFGATAQFAQHARVTRFDNRLFVREVTFSGAVRTLREIDLSTLPGVTNNHYSISSSLVDSDKPQPQLTVQLIPLTASVPSLAFFFDGDAGPRVVSSRRRWERGDAGITSDLGCRYTWPSGDVRAACSGLVGVDEGGVGWALQGPTLYRIFPPTDEAIAGPIPDARVHDGDRDAGRLAWPMWMSSSGDSLLVIDSLPLNGPVDPWRVRVVRRSVPDVVTLDAGFVEAVGATWFDGGVLALERSGRLTRFDDRLAVVSRTRHPELADATDVMAATDGIDVLRGNHVTHVTSDGTVSPPLRFPSDSYAYRAQPGPSSWFVMATAVEDGGHVTEVQQWFTDGGVLPIARLAPTRHQVQTLAMAGGDAYWLDHTTLRRFHAGVTSTVLELSDTPMDIIAFDDGSLVVSVSSALIRVVP